MRKFFRFQSRQGSKPSKNFSFSFDYRYTNLLVQQKIGRIFMRPLCFTVLQMVLWLKRIKRATAECCSCLRQWRRIYYFFQKFIKHAVSNSHCFDYTSDWSELWVGRVIKWILNDSLNNRNYSFISASQVRTPTKNDLQKFSFRLVVIKLNIYSVGYCEQFYI